MTVDPDELSRLLDDERITDYGRLVEAHGRLSRVLATGLRATADLPVSTFEVLLRVGRSPDHRLRMTELADQLVLTSGGATRLIDRVAAAGLVEKRRCDQDRRVQWVSLTPAGGEVLARTVPDHLDDLQRELVDRVDPDDLPTLRRALDQLRRR